MYQKVILILGLALVLFVVLTAAGSLRPSSFGPEASLTQRIEDCGTQALQRSEQRAGLAMVECYDSLFTEYLQEHSPALLVQGFQGAMAESAEVRRDCHQVAHAVGRATLALALLLILSGCSTEGSEDWRSGPVPTCDTTSRGRLLLMAQSVPDATLIPCIHGFPPGWGFLYVLARFLHLRKPPLGVDLSRPKTIIGIGRLFLTPTKPQPRATPLPRQTPGWGFLPARSQSRSCRAPPM